MQSTAFPHPLDVRRFDRLMRDAAGNPIWYTKVGEAPFSLATFLEAYSKGYFAWSMREGLAEWFTLAQRGILDFANIRISKSLRKEVMRMPFRVTFDRAFEQVIRGCAMAERQGEKTWITPEFIQAYTALHYDGFAHSVEVWNGERLVGGLYGVHRLGVFSGESMFYTESGASKAALLALIDRLSASGHTWMDTQMVTAFPAQIGARYVSYAEFMDRLRQAHRDPRNF